MKKTKRFHSVKLELDDETLFRLMLMAHERDITLNALVNLLLEGAMKKGE